MKGILKIQTIIQSILQLGNNKEEFKKNIVSYFSFFMLAGLFLYFSLASSKFLSIQNVRNILEQSGVLLAVAVGVTFVILSGSIDLSVGSVLGLAGGVVAIAIASYGPIGLLASIPVGAMCGLISGVIFAKARVPSFIVTLGMLTLARGVLLIVCGGVGNLIRNQSIRKFSFGITLGLPNTFLLCLLPVIFGHILLNFTPFGRNVKAVGGGENVAKMTGINVDLIKILVLVISGITAGIGGAVSVIRMGASSPNMGYGFELDVIAAVVLGGTTLTGGTGGVIGTIVGALVLGILNNGLNILGVSSYIQMILKGTIMILAVALTLDRKKIGIVK